MYCLRIIQLCLQGGRIIPKTEPFLLVVPSLGDSAVCVATLRVRAEMLNARQE